MVKPLSNKSNILDRLKSKNRSNRTGGKVQVRTMPKDKGDFQGSCNRSACLRPGASWYNHSTQKYYCQSCAIWLNTDDYNRHDAMQMFGHDLCTEGKYDEGKYRKLHDLHRNAQLHLEKIKINSAT
jgi:hypothetical protein